jgi:hypothetical protein
MMKKARWILPFAAALFVVSFAGAAELVVDARGTIYTVEVVQALGETSPDATALSFTILRPARPVITGTIPSTEDSGSDREPQLVLSPAVKGPFLVWTRNDGLYDQIVYSRLEGSGWGPPRYLTFGARDHVRPQVGVDGHGTATLAWVEPSGAGAVMFGIFDPSTGNLLAAPKNLLREMNRKLSPERLRAEQDSRTMGGRYSITGAWPLPTGGNDTPAIPPCHLGGAINCRNFSWPNSGVAADPTCGQTAVGVVWDNILSIGVLDGGVLVKHYRTMVPAGAPPEYAATQLRSILRERCR